MSGKKKTASKPPASAGNIISLDALLGNWPTIQLGGVQFEGRHFTQREKAAWLTSEQNDDADSQRQIVLDAVRARGADVTMEWIDAQPDVFLAAIVRGLYGTGWPGENPK